MPYNTIGANKIDYLDADYIVSYQLSGTDLELISEHYLKQGIHIYIENKVLSPSQKTPQRHAIDEMKHIAEGLNDGEYAGYIYTNQAGSDRSHFEAFIIGKNKMIKPAEWEVGFDKALNLSDYLVDGNGATNLCSFCDVSSIPQAGSQECGSLSISYLKNYLQDNARQIKEYTLCVPYYKGYRRELHYFFFPSPDVLRYSQSELYNKYIEAMLNPSDYVSHKNRAHSTIYKYMNALLNPYTGNFKHKDKPYHIIPLEQHLKNMIREATSRGNLQVQEQAKLLLSILPDFTDKWLDRYQSIKMKRQQMQTPKHNAYLAYTSQRMNRIARTIEQDKLNPGLPLLFELKKQVANQIPSSQIVLFLKQEIPKIPFQSSTEIGYFLKHVGEEFYTDLLTVFPDLLLKSADDFREMCIFLTPIQIKGLIQHMIKPENFERIVFTTSLSMYDIKRWLKALRIPTSETEDFLKKQSEKLAIQRAEEESQDVLVKLKSCHSTVVAAVESPLNTLIEKIETIRGIDSVPAAHINTVVAKTHQLLTGQINPDEYKKIASKVNNKHCETLQSLSVCMIILGAAVAAALLSTTDMSEASVIGLSISAVALIASFGLFGFNKTLPISKDDGYESKLRVR